MRFTRMSLFALSMLLIFSLSATAAPLPWERLGSLPDTVRVDQGISITYGNGLFLMVDGNTGKYTSPDGQQWTEQQPDGYARPLVKYLNGLFLAPSGMSTTVALSVSDDGLSWRAGPNFNTHGYLASLTYGRGRYLIGLGTPAVVSADLSQITRNSNPPAGLNATKGLAFGKGLFVAASGYRIYYSADGLEWTQATLPPGGTADDDLFGATYGNGHFVVVGRTGSNGKDQGILYTSVDGKNWTLPQIDYTLVSTQTALGGVVYGAGRFLAYGGGTLVSSEDGEHWAAEWSGAKGMIAYGAGRFIALGADRTVMTTVVCGSKFPDVMTDDPACDGIEQLANRQIIAGYPDGAFRPMAPVTRAELAKMLVLSQGLKVDPQGSLPFSDTAGHWAVHDGYVQAALAAGIINGFPDGTFRPNEPVTRAQVTKMVAAAAGLKPESGGSYLDVTGTEWFAGWVAAARHADLVGKGGYHAFWSEGSFKGDSPANRGDSATLLDNLFNY
jgi:hypothetical protein